MSEIKNRNDLKKNLVRLYFLGFITGIFFGIGVMSFYGQVRIVAYIFMTASIGSIVVVIKLIKSEKSFIQKKLSVDLEESDEEINLREIIGFDRK